MSLISDPDFLIHNIRLNYLKHVDDPYGARIITLDPTYHLNPYILDAGLADVERWPELALPSSPVPSDDEAPSAVPGRSAGRGGGRPSGFPGATGLKYTTTIMGPSRSGAMGLRTSGKRGSVSSRASMRLSMALENKVPAADDSKPSEAGAPTGPANASPSKADALRRATEDGSAVNGTPAAAEPSGHAGDNAAQQPLQDIPIPFIPKFKGAAEMEARRRLRMATRITPGDHGTRPPPGPAPYLNPEISSSSESESDIGEEEDVLGDDDEDFDDEVPDVDDSMDMDEFDPEYATNRGMGIDSTSDGASILSGTNSVISASGFSMVGSIQAGSARNRIRLSPVREGPTSEEKSTNVSPERREHTEPPDSYFEMVTPHPAATQANSRAPALSPSAQSVAALSRPSPGEDMFARRPVAPAKPAKSALSAMLASSPGASSNPFTELYSAISARAEHESMSVRVYFPHAREPAGRVMELKVRKDATVEEVLGFALCTYWEEGWLPKLDHEIDGEEDPKWATKCTALGWILRIAEEDGEVDEDFPPPDRSGKISKFNFDAYAVLEASPAQIQQNKNLESKIQRRPSRVVIKKKKSTGLLNLTGPAAGGLVPPIDTGFLGTSAGLGSLGSSWGMFPSSLGPSSSHGPPQFLRIRIADTADAGHVSTTIQASGGMYMAEVLEAVCQKRKLSNPKDYALVLDLNPTKLFIPLDRTVRSLQGKRDLILVKKNMLQDYGVEIAKRTGRTTDPNASIFKRNSDVPEQNYSSMFDYTTAYKKYTVYRKVPVLVARSARLLAIDGSYIHIQPLSNKAKYVFDSGKTSSYDMRSIVACQQSGKNSATFKLVIHREAERNKRYDFEAESPKIANEIVQTIRSLKLALERSGTVKQSRRSKHVS